MRLPSAQYSAGMVSDIGGLAQPVVRLAGHLVELLGPKHVGAVDRVGVAGARVGTAVARRGVPEDGEWFEFKVRSTHGPLGVDELPESGGRVLRSVNALLAGDRTAARAQLAAAEREPELVVRAENRGRGVGVGGGNRS
ncbi:hypothetical protein [Rhodococcus koreensis]